MWWLQAILLCIYLTSTLPRIELPLGSMLSAETTESVRIIQKSDTASVVSGTTAATPDIGCTWSKAALLATSAPSKHLCARCLALILVSSYPPVPARLVEKIRAGGYVEMKELMPDNISLLQALEVVHPAMHLTNPTKPKMRDVSDILTWVYCFLAYVAIRTPDKLTRDLLTYARILIREARKHGRDGWRAYDTVFRENAAASEAGEADWTKLESSLHVTTLVANRMSEGSFCHFCSEADHLSEDCALSAIKQAPNKLYQKAMHSQEEG